MRFHRAQAIACHHVRLSDDAGRRIARRTQPERGDALAIVLTEPHFVVAEMAH